MASLEGWSFTIKLCPRRSSLMVPGDERIVKTATTGLQPRSLREGGRCATARPRHYFSKAAATSVALCPPNPKELFRATRTFLSRATFGV